MGKVQQARQWFDGVSELECVENTYIADRAGKRVRITKPGATVLGCEMDGRPFRLSKPSRAGDVVAQTSDTITYKIGREEHTVTYRKVE